MHVALPRELRCARALSHAQVWHAVLGHVELKRPPAITRLTEWKSAIFRIFLRILSEPGGIISDMR